LDRLVLPAWPAIFAGRHTRLTAPNDLSIIGQNKSMIASVVIEPIRPFDQKASMSPPKPIIEKRIQAAPPEPY